MPWVVGLDEAGYGPNLGPLVQAAVAVHVPEGIDCLWTRLAAVVRRAHEPDDHRLLIDDSKLVNVGPNGLARLERGVAVVARGNPLGQLLEQLACGSMLTELAAEPWFRPDEPWPVAGADCDPDAAFPDALSPTDIEFAATRCAITPTRLFNARLDRWGSKAAPLAEGVIALLQSAAAALPGNGDVVFVVDKQGGRNYYAPLIQTAFPDGWVVPVRESAECSEYRVEGVGRDVRLTFRPRAEQSSLPVALASMVAKYLREVLMRQFNQFWVGHVPGLAPTAGYPNDAKRFYQAIRPAMARLGIPESAVWRKK